MSASVYVGIGSNLEREARIRGAIVELRNQFGELELSPVYDSAAVGFEGSDFLNLVASFDTEHEVDFVVAKFHAIEDQLGRDRSLPKYASRLIDLDILLYGDLILDVPGIRIPRPEILENAFVLKPLQDLSPDALHPEAGQSYRELWQQMEPGAPRLEEYLLNFQL